MSEKGTVTRVTALAAVMAAVMLLGLPALNLSVDNGRSLGAVGSAEAAEDVDRIFTLGIGELTADSLNPNTATMVSEFLLIYYCYSYLWGYDVDTNIIGDLATDWEVSPDGLTWHFELARNAYFCDPAHPYETSHQVTASDVVFSFWEVQNHTSSRLYSFFPGVIEDMTYNPADPFDLTIEFSRYHATVRDSWTSVPILPRYYWEGSDFINFDNLPPIGSGPLYYATDGLPDSGGAELATNPIWFQTENKGWKLHTDSWLIKEVLSPDAALIDLNTGEIDCYSRLTPELYLSAVGSTTYPNTVGFSQAAGFVYEYNLNQMTEYMRSSLGAPYTSGENNQLLLDPTVKMAMAMAVDKHAFVNDPMIVSGLGSYADSLVPPNNPQHYWVPDPIEFDLTAARQLLWDAGWQFDRTGAPATSTTCPLAKVGGKDVLSFRFFTLNTGVTWENAADQLVDWASKIGVELNKQIKTVSQMNSDWYSADYDVWLWDWVMGVLGDASGVMEVLTTMSIGSSSDVYLSDAYYDNLYNLSLTTVDPAERQEILNEMQEWAYWNLGCQCIAYSNDNYAVSTVTWDPDSLGDWNTKYMLLPETSAQWNSMQMYPNDNHAPQFTSYTGSTGVVIADMGVSENFVATALDDDATTLKEYRWFWGDGSSTSWSSGGSASHTYAEDGIYEVWVAVREAGPSNGFLDYFQTSAQVTVAVYDMSNMPPTGVSFDFVPADPDAGTYIVFTGSATDPEGDTLYYAWDFGDGHSSGGQVVEYQYGAEGSFTVTLSVTDNRLGYGTRPVTHPELIYVAANQPPTISVGDFPDIPKGQSRTYTVTASDAENSLRFTWDWGDKSSLTVTTAPSATHTYDVRGTYTLQVWADDLTGLDGHNVSDTGSVYVYNPSGNKAPQISGFTVDDGTPNTFVDVLFTATASDQDGDALTFTIQFGDGTNYVEEIGPNSGEVLTVTAEHAYETDGTKTAWLYVTDGLATASRSVTLSVNLNWEPTLEPLPDVQETTGIPVTVTAVADDWDGDPLTYTWEWGDGILDVTYESSATHTYDEPYNGVYRLYVDDGQGHNISEAALVEINSIPQVEPLPELSLEVGEVHFFVADVVDDDSPDLMWDFGDSSPYEFGNVVGHAYVSPGTYTYTVWVDDGFPVTGHNVSAVGTANVYSSLDYGWLRAVTNPAVPGMIYIDGEWMSRWGLDWVKLNPGEYTLSFGDVLGLVTPAPQVIEIVAGEITYAQGDYVAMGSLRVITDPAVPSTVYVDDIPRNDWGFWNYVPAGTYTVSFGAVADMATPPSPQTVTVTEGGFQQVIGTFTSSPGAPGPDPATYGMLRVTTSPAVPTMVYLDGEWMSHWGLDWVKVAPGTHTLSFSDVTPDPVSVEITAGMTTSYEGVFELAGTLRVMTSPPVPSTIYVNDIPRNDWGLWVDVPVGTYTVSFGEVEGLIAPVPQVVTVTAGGYTEVTGIFT